MTPPITDAPAIGWQLPPFYCPIEPAIHPDAADLQKQAVAWADSFGLYPDEVERAWGMATHSTDFSCRIIPYGEPETLLLFILWNHWAFALDDVVHDTYDPGANTSRSGAIVDFNTRVARTLEVPGSRMLGTGPFAVALEDLAVRTRAATTPAQFHLVTEGLRDWLFGAAWQAANTERGVMPSLADYVAVRPGINGTRFSLAWSLLSQGIDVPTEEYYSDRVQALTDVAGFVVSCDNDLFSYAKDDSHREVEQNLVNVLAHQRGCAPHEVVAEAVAMRDRCMTLFLRLRERIARDASPELCRYLDALGHYIVGCILWMNDAPRYASPRNRHPLPVPGASWRISWSAEPSDPGPEPIPVPTAAWWWKQLG